MTEPQTAEERVALNRQLAQMLKGGVQHALFTPRQRPPSAAHMQADDNLRHLSNISRPNARHIFPLPTVPSGRLRRKGPDVSR